MLISTFLVGIGVRRTRTPSCPLGYRHSTWAPRVPRGKIRIPNHAEMPVCATEPQNPRGLELYETPQTVDCRYAVDCAASPRGGIARYVMLPAEPRPRIQADMPARPAIRSPLWAVDFNLIATTLHRGGYMRLWHGQWRDSRIARCVSRPNRNYQGPLHLPKR